jgi:hypothetical protein
MAQPNSNNAAWNARASFIQTNNSTASCVFNWDNNAVGLTNGLTYSVTLIAFGQ